MSISSVDSGPLHVKPEVDLNLATEANRILYVLNKIIERAKFVGLLREFLKDDGLLLQDIFQPYQLSEILQKCDRYLSLSSKPTTTSSNYSDQTDKGMNKHSGVTVDGMDDDYDGHDEDEDAVDDLNSESVSEQSSGVDYKIMRKHDELTEVIYILEEKVRLRKLAEEMADKLSPEMKFFVRSLTEFKNRMGKHLNENATQYKTREQYMRETYQKNEIAKKEIEKLEEELLVTKTDANVCLIGRNILIKRHQQKIDKIRQTSQDAIEKRVKESEKAMVNNWKQSAAKQDQLNQDVAQASEKFSNLLRDHLAVEKTLRGKRAKVENQVLGWIQKFDQDIGEKQAEEEEIQSLLDDEMKAVAEIQSKLDEQEEEYDELMQEKAEYEEEMLERRLYQFIVNRSARRIQRTFRLFKARKLAKKLAKKGKGKKKGKK